VRGAALVRAGAGLAELAGPDRPPFAALWERPVDDRMRLAARALAARNLATTAILAFGPSRRVRTLVATVDGVHAASMVALALASESYRRPALVSAAMATALALVTAR
jgi:hypothetical protein